MNDITIKLLVNVMKPNIESMSLSRDLSYYSPFSFVQPVQCFVDFSAVTQRIVLKSATYVQQQSLHRSSESEF